MRSRSFLWKSLASDGSGIYLPLLTVRLGYISSWPRIFINLIVAIVPYFSWQRSHALHHANTNHISDGETHVPPVMVDPVTDKQKLISSLGRPVGSALFGFLQLVMHLLVGWPAYLLFGATGGPSRGITNHFIPIQVDKKSLFGKKQGEESEGLFYLRRLIKFRIIWTSIFYVNSNQEQQQYQNYY